MLLLHLAHPLGIAAPLLPGKGGVYSVWEMDSANATTTGTITLFSNKRSMEFQGVSSVLIVFIISYR